MIVLDSGIVQETNTKLTGKIVSNPGHLQYIVKTNIGKIFVNSTESYNISDKVVVFNGYIQGYAGETEKPRELLV